jgi:AraC-like DNA-binding protein
MSFFDFFRAWLWYDLEVNAKRIGRHAPAAEPRYFSTQVSTAQRFFLDLNPAIHARRKLIVVSGGCEHCRPDYEIRRDQFPFATIEFVAQGAGRLSISGREYALAPGTVFVYAGDTPYRMTSDPSSPLVKYFVAFVGEAGHKWLDECHLECGQVIRVAHPDQIEQVFTDLIRHGRGDHPDRGRMCAVAVQYLIMKIGNAALHYDETAGRAFDTYQRCRRFIEENYASVRSLREVADACHVNLSHLCRLFQRFGRETPNRYLHHLRLNLAAELLQGSSRPIKDVASILGFSDPFSFSRAFQRAFGLSPGRARRMTQPRRDGVGSGVKNGT